MDSGTPVYFGFFFNFPPTDLIKNPAHISFWFIPLALFALGPFCKWKISVLTFRLYWIIPNELQNWHSCKCSCIACHTNLVRTFHLLLYENRICCSVCEFDRYLHFASLERYNPLLSNKTKALKNILKQEENASFFGFFTLCTVFCFKRYKHLARYVVYNGSFLKDFNISTCSVLLNILLNLFKNLSVK